MPRGPRAQLSTEQNPNKATASQEFLATATDGHRIELSVFHGSPIGSEDLVPTCPLPLQRFLRSAGPRDSFEAALCGGEAEPGPSRNE